MEVTTKTKLVGWHQEDFQFHDMCLDAMGVNVGEDFPKVPVECDIDTFTKEVAQAAGFAVLRENRQGRSCRSTTLSPSR